MHQKRSPILTVCSLAALAALLTGCNFTTAHLASFKVGKDADVTAETATFAPTETIYAKAEVANVPDPVTVKITTFAEKVEGQPDNSHIEAFDKSFDVAKDSTVTYNLTPGENGWPVGKYRLEAHMFVGTEDKSSKIAEIEVKAP